MICIIDFETTGLTKESHDFMVQPGICQIGAIKLRTEGMAGSTLPEIDSFDMLINPELPESAWEEGAMKTHGITPEQVKHAPTFYAAFNEFAEFVCGCDTWGGYNNQFDKKVLWHQLMRYGFEKNFPWPPRNVDVMDIARREANKSGKKGLANIKLTEAHILFVGHEFEGAHGALNDVRAAASILRKIGKDYL